jgi:hypothetical protein
VKPLEGLINAQFRPERDLSREMSSGDDLVRSRLTKRMEADGPRKLKTFTQNWKRLCN